MMYSRALNRFGPSNTRYWLAILVAGILQLTWIGSVHPQPLTKIRVANIGGTSDHIQVAINGGIYKKHGFDVENIQVGSSATVAYRR